MTEDNTTQTAYQTPTPNPALKDLDVLVGTWDLIGRESGPLGEIHGQVSFSWLDGSFSLMQNFYINHAGREIKGVELIGYELKWGAEAPSKDCRSHVFDNTGNHLEYVYEVEDDTLIIWGGEKGSPAAYRGKITPDKNTISGSWTWPGGGYESTMTRVK